MSTRTVAAKVATVIDDHQVALNVGSDLGVAVGNDVVLYRTVEVTDPDSAENLGSVRLRKVRMSVNHVQERLCTARVTDRATASSASKGFDLWTTSSVVKNSARPLVRIVEGHDGSALKPGEVEVSIGELASVVVADATEVTEDEEELEF